VLFVIDFLRESLIYQSDRSLAAAAGRRPGRRNAEQNSAMPHTFPNIGNAAEFVGQTPWSARVPLDPLSRLEESGPLTSAAGPADPAPAAPRWCVAPEAGRAMPVREE